MLKYSQFIKLFEGGNAIEDARPLTQEEVISTYKWVEKNIFPKIGLEGGGIDATPIGSYAKKLPHVTSGDIDIAISIDKIAGANSITLDSVLDWLDKKLKSLGYSTRAARGFSQVSFGCPIGGDWKIGVAQVDLMLSGNLDWSRFMYYSPNFIESESKYKGLYRNVLLMSIVSEALKEVTKSTDKGEVEEYKQYVIRLEKGMYEVKKTFMGKKGLVKTPSLIHDQDKFITSAPEDVTRFAMGEGVQPSDIMTFENIWKHFKGQSFPHKAKFESILKRFKDYIVYSKMPIPTEVVEDFPNLFKN